MKSAFSYLFILLLAGSCLHSRRRSADWPYYGGNPENNRYSPLKQIDLNNVGDLRVAWTYPAADPVDSGRQPGPKRVHEYEIQCQPIVVNGILYGTNGTLKLFALQAATGKELWRFDPFAGITPRYNRNRGVVYWENGNDRRILYVAGSNLYAVDARTGRPVAGFGEKGRVSLFTGLDINHPVNDLYVTATSPGIIYKNLIILGSAVSESGDAAPGYVRGFDVRTGRLVWNFHTIPQPGEPGYETWPPQAYRWAGGANNWGGLSLDEKRGLLYFGTGSPSSDFYGGGRTGENLYGNCIVALQAATGKLKWYYQTIHHDLWDRDIPCPPNLTTIQRNGKPVDVLVQTTKDGLVYVLDRDSGVSVFPVEERPVPTQGLPGEHPWPVQKFPLKPLPLCNQFVSDSDITNISPESHAYVKKIFEEASHGKKFLPPSIKGTLLTGYSGGAEWGGNAIDPNGVFYQNSNNALWLLRMISRADRQKEMAALSRGYGLYLSNCSGCHGADRKGNGGEVPALLNIGNRLKKEDIGRILRYGQGRMPSFQSLPEADRNAIAGFLESNGHGIYRAGAAHPNGVRAKTKSRTRGKTGLPEKPVEPADTAASLFPYRPPYLTRSWEKLTDSAGYPGIRPPWGTLNAIDLNTGDYLWRVPLGEYPELTKKGVPITGTESYGGPLATAGGLVFIAGTRDERFRAFNSRTGAVAWSTQLPAGGFATPITYAVDGKQYIVIAAGGARGLKPGGDYIAFCLPDKDLLMRKGSTAQTAGLLILALAGVLLVFQRFRWKDRKAFGRPK